MKNNKKGFIIIFSRQYFYFIGILIILFLGYSYLIDNELIAEDNLVAEFLEISPRNITLIESEIHRLVNEERIAKGLNPLRYESYLAERATTHSNKMAIGRFLQHDNLFGIERGENVAYTPIGDVIGCGSVYDETEIAKCTVNGWMTSPGHRANILDYSFYCEGIGVAISTANEVYITQKFC